MRAAHARLVRASLGIRLPLGLVLLKARVGVHMHAAHSEGVWHGEPGLGDSEHVAHGGLELEVFTMHRFKCRDNRKIEVCVYTFIS